MTECNVGGTDRIARLSIGSLLLGAGLIAPTSRAIRIAIGVLGAAGLVTGLARYCPASKALGRNTCKVPKTISFVS